MCKSQSDQGEPKINLRTSLKALVLIIPFALAACASQQEASSEKDIVDTAVEAGQFNTLVAAMQAADLVDTLKSDGPFTVFAPTDAAFAKFPDGTVETLLKPENMGNLEALLRESYKFIRLADDLHDIKVLLFFWAALGHPALEPSNEPTTPRIGPIGEG